MEVEEVGQVVGVGGGRSSCNGAYHQAARPKLTAALSLWDYAARSAASAINHSAGDPLAEQIHAASARSPDGLTRTQIRDLTHRNLPAQRVDQPLQALARAGRATRRQIPTAGRPAETWTATKPAA